ncbi:MAG: hypothetical protein ACREQ5_13740 [Candidatus Dormibacteria bacterium]
MTLGNLDNQFRVYVAEPNNQGRWSQNDVATLVNEAQNYYAIMLRWPDASYFNTLPGSQQEFTLPEILEIDRVYLNGQPIVPTSIPALEGTDIELYDQSAANNTPQWNQTTYQPYPVTNVQYGYPQGMTVAPIAGQGARPNYYLRGGNLGFVPPPSASYFVQVDGIGLPLPLALQTDISIFPSFFQHILALRAALIAFTADQNLQNMAAIQQQITQWERNLLSWKRALQKNKPTGPRVISYRNFYNREAIIGSRWR